MRTAAMVGTAEAAAAFGITAETLEDLLITRSIPEARYENGTWLIPTDALADIAERNQWGLNLNQHNALVAIENNQLEHYISDTMATHAALVLARTQAAAARAETSDLNLLVTELKKALEQQRREVDQTKHYYQSLVAQLNEASQNHKIAEARLEELRNQLETERGRGDRLAEVIAQLQEERVHLLTAIGRSKRRKLSQTNSGSIS